MWLLQWWRRRWGAAAVVPPVVVDAAPSPHRLEVVDPQGTTLDPVDPIGTHLYFEALNTTLEWLDESGAIMAQPLIITAGETGDLDLRLVGADGAAQDLTGATCTLRLVNINGTVYANNVSLTVASPATDGIVTWNRLSAHVADAGDYRYQVKAVLSGGQPVWFPDASPNPGNPLTILPAV